jgi:rod shape-determining protein MreD
LISEIVKYSLVLLLLITVQKAFIELISISEHNIQPDIVIVAVVYISVRRGQIFGSIFGFSAGLILDILGGSFLGLLALCYSISGFIAGFFSRDEGKYLYKINFLYVLLFTTAINYFIYFMVYFQGAPISFGDILFKFVISTTVYTGVISLLYVFMPQKTNMLKAR